MTRGLFMVMKEDRDGKDKPVFVCYRNGDCFPAVIIHELERFLPFASYPTAAFVQYLEGKFSTIVYAYNDGKFADENQILTHWSQDYIYRFKIGELSKVLIEISADRIDGEKKVFSGTFEDCIEWKNNLDAQVIGYDDDEDVYDANGNYLRKKQKSPESEYKMNLIEIADALLELRDQLNRLYGRVRKMYED